MKIVSCRKSRVTGELLREIMPDSLREEDVVVNLGNSSFNESPYYNYDFINGVEPIRNCVDKERMLRLLKEGGVPCLEVVGNEGFGKKAFKRGKGLFVGRKSFRSYDYATKWEDKKEEFRVVVFRGDVLRAMRKEPEDGVMDKVLKQRCCRYRHVDKYEIGVGIFSDCIKACEALGIDLAGVDVLVNMKGEVKIIEVNSGMGLGSRTAGRLFRAIERGRGLR